ncbi:MAG TPA: LamG domain-containing protein [Polyangiaceae bacterium]|nr:LamG domain-containing protein [Polyangiaceae bacterium]
MACVGDLDISGKQCPCPDDWQCDPLTKTCVAEIPGGAFYARVVLADRPIAYWRLGERTGSQAHDELGGHDGLYLGNVELGVAGAIEGDVDSCVGLDEINDAVEVDDAGAFAFAGAPPYSLEAWVFHRVAFPASGQSVAMLSRANAASDGLFLGIANDQLVCSRGGASAIAEAPLAANTWTHVVGTFDGGLLRLYLNGAEVGSAPASDALVASTAKFRIGAAPDWPTLNGYVDEVAVYDRALGATTIGAHFEAAFQP